MFIRFNNLLNNPDLVILLSFRASSTKLSGLTFVICLFTFVTSLGFSLFKTIGLTVLLVSPTVMALGFIRVTFFLIR